MLKERKIIAEKIHITNIRTVRGNIESPSDFDMEEINGHRFEFDLKTALKKESKLLGLKLQVDIIAQNEANEDLPAKGSYTHEMVFLIENLDDFIDTEKGVDLIDPSLGSTLVSIIYSTVRGIIYSRTQGTSLDAVVLPVVAPLKLMGIEKDMQLAKIANSVKGNKVLGTGKVDKKVSIVKKTKKKS